MTPAPGLDVSPRLAWLASLFSMLAVFLFFSRGHGVRYAFMLSLLWGKVVAGVHRFQCSGYSCYPVLTQRVQGEGPPGPAGSPAGLMLWCGRRDLNPGPPAWKAGVLVQARRRPPAPLP